MFRQLCTDKTGATIQLRVLTNDKIEDAISIQQESMHQECIAIGVGLYDEPGGPEGMQPVFREVIKEGCSLIAIDVRTGEVVAVAFNKLFIPLAPGVEDPFATFVENNVKRKSCLDLISFLDHVESKVNLYEKCNVRALMEIFYVGTKSKYQGRGIGEHLIRASVEFGRELLNGKTYKVPINGQIANEHVVPEAVFGVFASNYSQRIAEKLNFQWLVEVAYEGYLCNGKNMSERIGDFHKSAKLGVFRL